MRSAVLRFLMGAAASVCLWAGEPAAVIGDLPIRFEPNRGQWDAGVKYSAAAPGYRLVVRGGEATLALSRGANETPAVVGFVLRGARQARRIEALEPLRSTSNYFLGARRNWRTGVPQYGRVRASEVYPGIDLVYYGTGRQLEFDFVVRPGANPNRIRMTFRGADRLSLTPEGDLLLEAGGARLTQKRPVAYQRAAAGRREVAAHYRMLGRNEVGVGLEKYDPELELTIDPVLAYSSLLGGSGSDAITAVKVDKDGMIYVAGYVAGSEVAAIGNPYKDTSAGGTDAFLAKINPSAQGSDSLAYFTYFGGSGADMAQDMALGADGYVYLTGTTASTDFPLAGSTVSNDLKGGTLTDAFVVKLNPSFAGGDALWYSSYLGGSDADSAYGIALDAQDNVYVVGTTKSEDFPLTDSAYQKIRWGPSDVFVAKIDTNASPSLVYSSYIGGESSDDGRAIAVSPSGMVYVAGATISTQFPYWGNAYRMSPTGLIGTWVSQFDMTKSGEDSIIYSTYLGGSGWDEVRKIALDANGKLILTGFTLSPDFPTTPDALQTVLLGNSDVFVTRVNTAAPPDAFIEYSTFLGGSGGDAAQAIAVDGDNVTVTGYTLSKDFPVTPDALAGTWAGGVDVFVTRFSLAKAGREALEYSSFLGGVGIHTANAVTTSADGSIYVGGLTAQQSVPTTGSGAQTSYGGGMSDGFVLAIKP